MKKAICLLVMLLIPLVGAADQLYVPPDMQELIDAVVSRSEISFPACPPITKEVKYGVEKELSENPALMSSYKKLDVKRRNVEWFEGIKELDEAKAVWALATGLCHPYDDVQIKCARALGDLKDKRPLQFMLAVAEKFAVIEGGSENATLHGLFQHALADALNKITGTNVVLQYGQDPEGLKKGIMIWRTKLDNELNPVQLAIQSDKQVYSVGESVKLTIKVKNASKEDVYIDGGNLNVQYHVQEENDNKINEIPVLDNISEMPGAESFRKLPAEGEETTFATLFIEDSEWRDFQGSIHKGIGIKVLRTAGQSVYPLEVVPGVYKIKMNWAVNDTLIRERAKEFGFKNVFSGKLISNTIIIEVLEKNGKLKDEAFKTDEYL